MDVIVLMARLVRVLMKMQRQGMNGGMGAGEDDEERVSVRNACLDEPFFQRAWGGRPPFGGAPGTADGEEVDDEGCVV